jgi:hypothetical protein
VDSVRVTCTTNTYSVSGSITGLTAAGLSLTNTYTGGGGPETISPASGAVAFAFQQLVKSGADYSVKVSAQPPGLFCSVNNGTGTVVGSNIPGVEVACQPAVSSLSFNGAEQTFKVPAGVTALDVVLEGAQGGNERNDGKGLGGKLSATLPVTAGELLYIYVGGQPVDTSGGFNGGGAGDSSGRGGGGATDIRRGGNTIADRILVAGGGGGGGGLFGNQAVEGGAGGGLTGGAGLRVPDNAGGGGGTQTQSGLGTCQSFNNAVVSGGLGFGGTTAGKNCGCNGYGGGGGYYGGAASGNCRGGGGGSAFTAPAANATNIVHTACGAAPGNGRATITLK